MTSVLKVKVPCYRCHEEVDKLQARQLDSPSGTKRYECFSCFKKFNLTPSVARRAGSGTGFKLYCERCRYKFTSHKVLCPYCSKADYVVKRPDDVLELVDNLF